MSNPPISAIILAGGLGIRLRGLVNDRPKVLATVAGRPFIDFVLRYLAGQGIQRVILSVGYLADQVMSHVGNGNQWNLSVEYAQEQVPLGTGGALRNASAYIGKEPSIAMNGDTLFEINLAKLWSAHVRMSTQVTIALRRVAWQGNNWKDRGQVLMREDGIITTFVEKSTLPGRSEQPAVHPSQLVLTNGGVYVIEPGALNGIPAGREVSLEKEIFPTMVAKASLGGCILEGYFADIGTPEGLAAFENEYSK